MTAAERLEWALSQVALEPSPQRRPSSRLHLTEAMERLSVPGVGIALVSGGEIAAVKSLGVGDHTDAIARRTLFQAGSVSKPVAALVALRLVASGDMELDADISDALASWRIPEVGGWRARLTLRQLLSHTAGLTVHGFAGYPPGMPVPTLQQVLSGSPPANSAPVVVRILPGSCFSYSGGGYCVVQQLLEDRTGEPFPRLARRLVLDPLGMEDSGFEQPLPEARHGQAASGHRTAGVAVEGRWHIYPEMAAAGLWTTPSDLARFTVAIQHAKARQPDSILPGELIDEMLTAQAANVPYGLGLQLQDRGGHPRFYHSGDDEGFVATMMGYVDRGEGVAVMANSDRGGDVISAVVSSLARAMGWPGLVASDAPPGNIRDGDLARIGGHYESAEGLRVTVLGDRDGALMQVEGQDPLRLWMLGPHRWCVPHLDVELDFRFGSPGPASAPATEMRIIQTAPYAQDIIATRADP